MINIVAAECARQFLQQIQFFQGAMRRGQRADRFRSMLGLDIGQAVGHILQRGLPIGFAPLAALLHHGHGQTLGAVQRFIGEAIPIRQPAFVHRFVFVRQHTHYAILLNVHGQVGAQAIMRADRRAAAQFPGTRGVAERFRSQRADRAQIDHVAGDLGINCLRDEGHDFGMFAARRLT